jgi:hypothetical protein
MEYLGDAFSLKAILLAAWAFWLQAMAGRAVPPSGKMREI